MVGHETKSVNPISEAAGPLLQQEIETVEVVVDEKNRLATVAS